MNKHARRDAAHNVTYPLSNQDKLRGMHSGIRYTGGHVRARPGYSSLPGKHNTIAKRTSSLIISGTSIDGISIPSSSPSSSSCNCSPLPPSSSAPHITSKGNGRPVALAPCPCGWGNRADVRPGLLLLCRTRGSAEIDFSQPSGGFTRVEGRKKPSAGPGALNSRRHASARVAEAAAAVAAEAVLSALRGRRGGLARGGLELMAAWCLHIVASCSSCCVVELSTGFNRLNKKMEKHDEQRSCRCWEERAAAPVVVERRTHARCSLGVRVGCCFV